jgi:hypothetical protein
MTLDELVRSLCAAGGATAAAPESTGAPDWAIGCFKRRSITFFDGATDTSTEVTWLQTPRLTFDLRLPAARPSRRDLRGNDDLSPDACLALAQFEGGLARTSWDGERMAWSAWCALQLHDKWPEPGLLRRVGDCLIEHAPSGAYVEDWRLQPSSAGPLLGLRLLEERDLDRGVVVHRGGGLLVCGEHAGFVRGRPRPFPARGRLVDAVRAAANDPDLLRAAFAFEASYGKRAQGGDSFTVLASTDPRREQQPLLALDGFELGDAGQSVVQRSIERGRSLERLFTVEVSKPDFPFPVTTFATSAAHAWLSTEADTLLATTTGRGPNRPRKYSRPDR